MAFATYIAAGMEGKEMTALRSMVFSLMPPSHKRMEESGTMEKEQTVVMGGRAEMRNTHVAKKGDSKRRRLRR